MSFSHPFVAALIAIAVWWLATGVVIVIARKGCGHVRLTMGVMSVLAVGAIVIMTVTADRSGAGAAYVGFASALVVWAWHEVAFLLGLVTGPRTAALERGTVGWRRFRMAFATVRDHELALFATLLCLIWLLHDAVNQSAMWTFVLLWTMRISTKLNIFLGAPNAISELLPDQLSYLTSYFRTDRMHPLFPFSIALAAIVFTLCAYWAAMANSEGALVSWSVLAAFAALGLLEHLFLVLPVRDGDIWRVVLPKDRLNNSQPVASVRGASASQTIKKGSVSA